MKFFKISLLIFAILPFIACNDAPERRDGNTGNTSTENAPDIQITTGDPASTTTPTITTNEPAQNADGVWHYICPDGHEGGAGSAEPCAVCGKTLVHNTAYHNSATNNPVLPPPTTGGGNDAQPFQATPEPAQNANGVWHYTCPNGCEGGAGVAQACAVCGTTLKHNAAYHN